MIAAPSASTTTTLTRLLLLACLLLFLFVGQTPERSRFWIAFFDAGHAPLFGVIALLIRDLLASRRRAVRPSPPPVSRSSPLAFALAVILGGATELLQVLQRHGDPSVSDLLRDAAGAGAFLLVAAAVKPVHANREGRRPRAALRWLALPAALVLLLAAGRTLIVTSAAYAARNRAFPTLFALDGSWWERVFVETGRNALTPGSSLPTVAASTRVAGPALARLDLRPGRYSGIALMEPYPDWRGYRCLAFTIVSDLDSPLPMAIRIHDAAHDQRYADRFNRRFLIRPGTNDIAIPIEDIRTAPDRRTMDLRRVRGILVFAYGLTRRSHIYLSSFRLE